MELGRAASFWRSKNVIAEEMHSSSTHSCRRHTQHDDCVTLRACSTDLGFEWIDGDGFLNPWHWPNSHAKQMYNIMFFMIPCISWWILVAFQPWTHVNYSCIKWKMTLTHEDLRTIRPHKVCFIFPVEVRMTYSHNCCRHLCFVGESNSSPPSTTLATLKSCRISASLQLECIIPIPCIISALPFQPLKWPFPYLQHNCSYIPGNTEYLLRQKVIIISSNIIIDVI